MNSIFKIDIIASLVGLTILMTSHTSVVAQDVIPTNKCYSVYQIEQKLALSVVLGDSIQKQNIYLKMDVHIREVATSLEFISKLNKQNQHSLENIRSYVMLLKPLQNNVNGVARDFVQRHLHPFLVNVDTRTGELIEIESTTDEKTVIKEYLGYFDLFQYAKNDGDYRYRNGNGHYKAHLTYSNDSNNTLTKTNTGYLDSNKLKLKRNSTLIEFSQTGANNDCFYQTANATEMFTNNLTKGAYMKGDASISISVNNETRLPSEHFFLSLTSDISEWPSFNQETKLTPQQAFERLPALFHQLQFLVDDKMAFLALFKDEKSLWPFLTDFMTQENSNSKLVNRVIWSLSRINSTESVSSLLKVSMSKLPSKNIYRSILAMITSSAEINQQGIDELKDYLSNLKHSEENSQESMLLLRSLGALAKQRSQHYPMQSQEIRQYLYTHAGGSSEQFKSSLYESIGAMGKSIDREGVELIMKGLSEKSTSVKDSAINALTKIPYQKNYGDLYIAELESELYSTTKEKLIELLGKTDKKDSLVKNKLLSIVNDSNTFSINKKSIASLKQVGFEFNDNEIKILESRLRKETDKSNQIKLASLILKQRRQ